MFIPDNILEHVLSIVSSVTDLFAASRIAARWRQNGNGHVTGFSTLDPQWDTACVSTYKYRRLISSIDGMFIRQKVLVLNKRQQTSSIVNSKIAA